MLATEAYLGNKWDIIIGSEEYWILWYLFRSLAFLVDRIRGVEYGPADKHPHFQYFRKFANIYKFVQLCIGIILTYFVLRIFVF